MNYWVIPCFSACFCLFLPYWIGVKIKARFQWTLLNPLLIAIVLCIVCLAVGNISYETFNQGAQYLSYLLTPATVCLALPMYRQMKVLKKNWLPVLAGVLSGCTVTLGLVLACGWFLKMEQTLTISLLPKSITTGDCHRGDRRIEWHLCHHGGGGDHHRHCRRCDSGDGV